MKPKDLQQKIATSFLTSQEKQLIWDLYKSKGISEALIAFEKIATHHTSFTQFSLQEKPAPYQIWGKDYIEEGALTQMHNATRLPIAVAGALMPDAHSGYGLPIGGVLATENAVIPYGVGVDIACRMMLTIYATSPSILDNTSAPEFKNLYQALLNNTIFGAGADGIHEGKIEHPILEKNRWQISKLTLSLRDTAIHQIGTSGSGNHFVEWGEIEITNPHNVLQLPVGSYLALLSHSGSRGVGYKIANYYTEIAMSLMKNLDTSVKHLAWLQLDHDLGREYWESMELAGEFASANHHVIHQRIAQAIGLSPIRSIENHHNFAWKEKILLDGKEKEIIVHRKGATPAQKDVLGIIPGTMADPGYLVIGKGNALSLNSASHGSGRIMSRTQAKKNITKKQQEEYLKTKNVHLIGGGLDEAPQAYKPIDTVIEAQSDLVDILGKFQPRIVRMASEKNSKFRRSIPKGIVDGE